VRKEGEEGNAFGEIRQSRCDRIRTHPPCKKKWEGEEEGRIILESG